MFRSGIEKVACHGRRGEPPQTDRFPHSGLVDGCPTFEGFTSYGLPLSHDERDKIESLMSAASEEVCSDLLDAVRTARRWQPLTWKSP
jgi:hypothetical protein